MEKHQHYNNSFYPPFPKNLKTVCLGLGCFWGAEKFFWSVDGVWTTAVGYAGGNHENPNYEVVCEGSTNHAEVVLVVYNPQIINLEKILKLFWEIHDPTQLNRQGNDFGTQYRSIVLVNNDEELEVSQQLMKTIQEKFNKKAFGKIVTEISMLKKFYYAESYHQQYLKKNPNGYCNLKGLDISLQN